LKFKERQQQTTQYWLKNNSSANCLTVQRKGEKYPWFKKNDSPIEGLRLMLFLTPF